MKAAVVYARNDMRLEEVALPPVPRGSIRVKVQACGICGTDRRIFRVGDYRAAYPVIPGHEIAGVVEAVGQGAPGFREGDRVCVAPGHGCGECRMCRSGRPNVCVRPFPSLGYKVNGGFADYLAVPENIFRLGFVNPIPESLSFEQAAMSEIVACCLNAQENTPVHAGDYVLIFGAGPAGLVHAILSHRRGARRVVVTQRSRQRLERIRQGLPIDRVIVSQDEDLDQIIWEETAGEGADVIYVCAPSREAQESATRLAAPRGRINFFGGLPRDDCVIHLDANALHYKEFFVGGASSSLPEGNRQALHLLADRTIDPDRLITHRFPLEDIHKGFAVMEAREALKVVICPWAS